MPLETAAAMTERTGDDGDTEIAQKWHYILLPGNDRTAASRKTILKVKPQNST